MRWVGGLRNGSQRITAATATMKTRAAFRMRCLVRTPPYSTPRLERTSCDEVLHPDHCHQLLHGLGTLVERGLFVGRKFDFDDLFNPLRSQLHRNTDVEAFDPILAFEISSAGQN